MRQGWNALGLAAALTASALVCASLVADAAPSKSSANGLHQFHKQAGLDVTFATLRVVGLLGMAMAGFGVVGVIGGWVAAVGVILCASIVWIGLPGSVDRAQRLPVRIRLDPLDIG